jgi:hypothetical protein
LDGIEYSVKMFYLKKIMAKLFKSRKPVKKEKDEVRKSKSDDLIKNTGKDVDKGVIPARG